MPTEARPPTITQAAKQLGISVPTLRKWAHEGQIRVVKLPSGYRRVEPGEVRRTRQELGFSDEPQS
jgi:excisionase family DNA binding protein